MLIPTVVLALCCAVVLTLILWKAPDRLGEGIKAAWMQFLQAFPLVALTFLLLGLLAVLVPREVFARWLSEESGLRGILVGSALGAVAPGGPVIQAIIASLAFKLGAGVGCLVAFLTAGALAHVLLLPLEVGLMGWRFVATRLACTIFFPPIAGTLAHLLFTKFLR